ncbi:HindVP family restriction endonuclease [Chroococcidiopsis sp. FACHB-1243]|uniref:HindVP family restriction endonuclease n=1 Tax=Chroococcidiopsis sp. [FACHB-1243] TaxID=2692781 RepID=UPI00177BEC7C|nr:HindVP family restriction endonuclease [Chroococcidiopsis sp. [FACHB-1243]]
MFSRNTPNQQPGLFGLKHSNRDFTQKDAWGKNCFNNSFPASLCAYLYSRNIDNIYIKLNSNLEVEHSSINTAYFYGINPDSDNLFYAFETQFTPYQQYLIGALPRADLVTQQRDTGSCLQAVEVKLTALPDNSTCDLLDESLYGCEIVVRPDTIVYLACSIAEYFAQDINLLKSLIIGNFEEIEDWTEPSEVITHLSSMFDSLKLIMLSMVAVQKPSVMQPIWKTVSKSPKLADNCLDVFVWSNLAFIKLILDSSKLDSKPNKTITVGRHIRAVVWLFKMIYDFSQHYQFDYRKIVSIACNTKNDKAFSVNGKFTNFYMRSEFLRMPRIQKTEIKEIILGGGQNLLSPERRFDAIICNSSDLFD